MVSRRARPGTTAAHPIISSAAFTPRTIPATGWKRGSRISGSTNSRPRPLPRAAASLPVVAHGIGHNMLLLRLEQDAKLDGVRVLLLEFVGLLRDLPLQAAVEVLD